MSFETAAKRLSADVLSLAVATSSVKKGESLRDTVETIEAKGVDFQSLQRTSRYLVINFGGAFGFGEVTHAPQQSPGDARCSPCAASDFGRALRRQWCAELSSRVRKHLAEVFRRVEIKPQRDAEAVPQGRGQDVGQHRLVLTPGQVGQTDLQVHLIGLRIGLSRLHGRRIDVHRVN